MSAIIKKFSIAGDPRLPGEHLTLPATKGLSTIRMLYSLEGVLNVDGEDLAQQAASLRMRRAVLHATPTALSADRSSRSTPLIRIQQNPLELAKPQFRRV